MAPKKWKPIKRKATTQPTSPTRATTRRTARAQARMTNDAPNPSTDAQVASSEGSAKVIINEEDVEALRQ